MFKRISYVTIFILAFAVCAFSQNVTVNPGGGSYATLTDAFNAINAGTHTGAVTVTVSANTTEPAGSAVLNSSGVGAASYTSVSIRPSADNVRITGAPIQGRGVIELNGADSVTIDGDNAATGGTNRNLTIENAAADTVRFTAVVRIALATTGTGFTDANNVIIRNLALIGNARDKNVAANTGTTASQNDTFGVFAGAGAAATPAAIASTTAGIAAGATASNLQIDNNTITSVGRAVSVNSSVTTAFPGLQVTGNVIGNPVAGAVDGVYAMGITVQGGTDMLVARNTIYVEGFIASSAANHGISLGHATSAGGGTATVEKNNILRVKNNNPTTFSAWGISIAGGTNHVLRNNFISGVINDQTAGTGGFGITFGAYGIRISSGTGHKVYHNSVHLYGAMQGTVNTNLTAGLMITANTLTGIDVRNNIFSNQITGGNAGTPGTRHVAVFLPSAGTATNNLTINNNGYYLSGDELARLAQVGTTFGTGEFTVGDFDPTATTPATNFRAYTSTLSAAGTNDNASFATTALPPFVSNSNLHIPAGTATRLESGGAAVGVADDIDAEARNATTPDIGGDEFTGAPAPANDIMANTIVVPDPGSIQLNNTSVTPQARFSNQGTAVQTNVSVRFTITGPGGYSYQNTTTIPTINPLQNVTVTFAAAPTFTTVGAYTMTASVQTPDSNASNDSIAGSFQVRNPVSGTVSVGTGGAFETLTGVGGLFDEINTVGAVGTVTINITTDLLAETGAVALRQFAGGGSVIIKPSGAARQIVSSTNTPTALIRFSGADNVTIDGSLSGGTDRSLSIIHGNTSGTVIWFASNGAADGVNNVTIKNTIITGKVGSPAVAGVLSGSGATLGGAGEAPHNNNALINNQIFRVQNGAFISGNATTLDANWNISGNTLSSTVAADKNTFRGMLIGNAQTFTIANNVVEGINFTSTSNLPAVGIHIASATNTGRVTGNRVKDIKHSGTSTAALTGAFGIFLGSASTASNVTVDNNFVWDIAGTGGGSNNGDGIRVSSGGGYRLYFNSVNMNTNQPAGTTAALGVATGIAAGALDVRNNILANTQTAGATRFSVFSASPATAFGTIDFNDYFSTQNVGSVGGVVAVTIADWRTATAQDTNSLAVDPLFVSPTDLHIQAGSPLLGEGTPIAGITTDIDGETRGTPPEIGADERSAVISNASITGRVQTAGGRGITQVHVFISGGGLPAPIKYITGSFGYFTFTDLPVGQTYTITVEAKRFAFNQPTRQVTLNGDVTDFNFVANP